MRDRENKLDVVTKTTQASPQGKVCVTDSSFAALLGSIKISPENRLLVNHNLERIIPDRRCQRGGAPIELP